MLNRIVLMGRLTRDPELRRTQNGTAVTSFTLAVDRDFKSQSGEKETDFIDCVAWRNTAEFVSKYFTKGRLAVAEGRLQLRDWTDRDGNKRRSAEVVVDNVYFGESKRESSGSEYGGPPPYGAPSRPSGPAASGGSAPYGDSEFSEIGEEDGELPF
ncbi:MAG: single-stranded DNA-binding protein [Oscillibacter sp.]|jgi:single-strand DNA-binding protein|nr:single-stranded DNA-binding protein [Oscillibacter sp.]